MAEAEQEKGHDSNAVGRKRLTAEVPEKVLNDIQLANQARLAPNYDDTVTRLLKEGLSACAPEIRRGLLKQLDDI